MKYFLCIFTDDRNIIFKTNSLKDFMDFYADNRDKINNNRKKDYGKQ